MGTSKQRREYVTESDEQTIELGRSLARDMQAPLLVMLLGNLGTGKTTIAKGIVSGLGAAREEDVTSPSFTLVHEYSHGSLPVFHVDLYRLEGARDIATLGLEDLIEDTRPAPSSTLTGTRQGGGTAFASPAIVLVEWGEKLHHLFPARRWDVHLSDLGGDRRRIVVEEWDG